jgi:hypothetical protein
LEKDGLKPVHPASKHDLLRRASLDLTGLPPTPAEYAAFEKDTSSDAFAKVVDRLLASPHYGERWGRVWLDVARYGEDDVQSLLATGHYRYPNAYLYRDWVVQSFNDDLPYDQFVKAQLAGDQMDPKDRYKTLPGIGFLGLGPWLFNTTVNEIARPNERNDRVDAVTRGFLGLTVQCARCHNHKYDPIPQTDYYALAGVFASTHYKSYPQVPQSVVDHYDKLEEVLRQKQTDLREYQTPLETEIVDKYLAQTANYLEGVWEATNPNHKKDVSAVVDSRKLDYEVLSRWMDYMSRSTKWHHEKDAWQAMMKRGGDEQEAKKLAEQFQAEIMRVKYAKREVDAENSAQQAKSGKGYRGRGKGEPSDYEDNDNFGAGLDVEYKRLPEADESFLTDIFQYVIPDGGYDPYLVSIGVLQVTPGPLSFTGWALESRVGAERWSYVTTLRKEIADLKKEIEPHPLHVTGTYMAQRMPAYPSIDGVEDKQVIDLPVSLGGSPYNPGPIVPRHFLTVLSNGEPAPFTKGSGRLELAENIVKQPIAMRVIVNRIWREHFGTGIVDSPSNFGTTGERPTNPELLEYLANEFSSTGMSIKKLHREIMLSATYQLSTDAAGAGAAVEKDPDNRLYWRANERRMSAEQLRDSVLAVAGSLDPSIGGPSAELSSTFTRRTIYGTVSRYLLNPYLQTFDYPNPLASAEKRFTSTVPLQRLFLMNSDFMQLRAEEVVKQADDQNDNRARVRKIYSLIFGRTPSEQEVARGLEFIRSEQSKRDEDSQQKAVDATASNGQPSMADRTSGAWAAAQAAKAKAGDSDSGFAGVEYEPTVWGRYVKVLLGSTEFIYIN